METVEIHGIGKCIKMTNGEVELIISVEIGPRILGYNFLNCENVLGVFADRKIETDMGEYSIYGGHRLWIAPENWPVTYAADDDTVEWEGTELDVTLTQKPEPISKTQKKIKIELAPSGTEVKITHAVVNLGSDSVELAPWALTIMRPGGTVLIPNEPFAPHGPDRLLPVRTFAVWSYTQLTDPRFKFDTEGLRISVDAQQPSSQKIGVLNKRAECYYELEDVTFTKKYGYKDNAKYPDFGVNTEIYTAGEFVEIETLGELVTVQPGSGAEHVEIWSLTKK